MTREEKDLAKKKKKEKKSKRIGNISMRLKGLFQAERWQNMVT